MEEIMSISLELANEQSTMELGTALSDCIPAPCNIYLEGDLGAGKTTLVRALLRARGQQGAVKSPTYTLVESYDLPGGQVVHMDLYRLADPEELEYIGIRDLLDGERTCLIEWPEKGAGILPHADLVVHLEYLGSGRRARLTAYTEQGKSILNCIELRHISNILV